MNSYALQSCHRFEGRNVLKVKLVFVQTIDIQFKIMTFIDAVNVEIIYETLND